MRSKRHAQMQKIIHIKTNVQLLIWGSRFFLELHVWYKPRPQELVKCGPAGALQAFALWNFLNRTNFVFLCLTQMTILDILTEKQMHSIHFETFIAICEIQATQKSKAEVQGSARQQREVPESLKRSLNIWHCFAVSFGELRNIHFHVEVLLALIQGVLQQFLLPGERRKMKDTVNMWFISEEEEVKRQNERAVKRKNWRGDEAVIAEVWLWNGRDVMLSRYRLLAHWKIFFYVIYY